MNSLEANIRKNDTKGQLNAIRNNLDKGILADIGVENLSLIPGR